MRPTQMSYQRYDNLLIRKDLCKLDHSLEVLFGKAVPVFLHQLS